LDKILLAPSLIVFHLFGGEEDECTSDWPGWKGPLLLVPRRAPLQNIAPYSNTLLPSAYEIVPPAELRGDGS